MNAIEAVAEVQKAVSQAKELGNTEVTVASLELFLERLINHIAQQAPMESAQLEFQKVNLEQSHQAQLEMFRSVMSTSQGALKSCLVVSGGGAAALLAFTSSTWSALTPDGLAVLSSALWLMGLAVLFAALASAFAYFTQYFYDESDTDGDWKDRVGLASHVLAACLVLGSYGLFTWACWKASSLIEYFNILKPAV
nr:hypothetical protein [Pseudomonas chengduensis]